MKKSRIIFVIAILILSIVLIPIAKNIYLYLTYEHGNNALLKGKDGRWVGIFDTYEHGMDERHVLHFDFVSDTSGYIYYQSYSVKINENYSSVYSWRSLLPFSESDARKYKSKILFDSEYITFLPGTESVWKDTLYSKYRVSSDSLFIDRSRKKYRYSDEPVWGIPFSDKPSIIKLFYIW